MNLGNNYGKLPESIRNMLHAAREPDNWLIENLIERGDQVIVAGPPKSGKSLLVTQIALSLANGTRFLSWPIQQKLRVLYVNLEVRKKRMAKRLLIQAGSESQLDATSGNLFLENDWKFLDIYTEHEQLAEYVLRVKPDLVIWDVLARMHNAEENDNGQMARIMLCIRQASGEAASIVVHHTRKPRAGMEDVNQGAHGMRGAGSIHGEGDLVISLHKSGGRGGPRHSLKFSARNIEEPDDICLELGKDLNFRCANDNTNERQMLEVKKIFGAQNTMLSTELQHALVTSLKISERTARSYLKSLVDAGFLTRQKRMDKRVQFSIV